MGRRTVQLGSRAPRFSECREGLYLTMARGVNIAMVSEEDPSLHLTGFFGPPLGVQRENVHQEARFQF